MFMCNLGAKVQKKTQIHNRSYKKPKDLFHLSALRSPKIAISRGVYMVSI